MRIVAQMSCVIVVLAACSIASAETRGVVGRPAPEWGVNQWLNLPGGKTTLDVSD